MSKKDPNQRFVFMAFETGPEEFEIIGLHDSLEKAQHRIEHHWHYVAMPQDKSMNDYGVVKCQINDPKPVNVWGGRLTQWRYDGQQWSRYK